MIKIMALAAALTIAVGTQAIAADLLERPPLWPEIHSATPTFSWTGFFAGGNIAYGIFNETISDNIGDSFNPRPQALALGGQLGGNYQIRNLVLGVEFDGEWVNVSRTTSNFFSPLGLATVTVTGDANWLTTVTGRAGIAFDRMLVFAKAGGGLVSNNAAMNLPGGGTLFSGSNIGFAWTAGAGVEYAFTDNWTVKGEYTYIAANSWSGSGVVPGTGSPYKASVQPSLAYVLFGVSYLFH